VFQNCSKQNEQEAADKRAKIEQIAADDKAKQETLTKYLDGMSDLLQKDLLKSKNTDPTFIIAQSKTVVALRSVDSVRQNLIFQFLESARLNTLELEKNGLLFRAKMSKAQLSKADFTKTKLIQADLQESNLTKANLTGADLRSVDLENANLSNAQLYAADLRLAELTRSNLTNANLAKADLTIAALRQSNMEGVKLDRAILNKVDLGEVKNLMQKQLDTKPTPYICNVKLPSNIKKLIPSKDYESYRNRDCDKLIDLLLDRYPLRYSRIFKEYPNRFKAENETTLDEATFKKRAAANDIAKPECMRLFSGAKTVDGCLKD
jgi:uncharacterized protein YjbI with pentapeptide repeats